MIEKKNQLTSFYERVTLVVTGLKVNFIQERNLFKILNVIETMPRLMKTYFVDRHL